MFDGLLEKSNNGKNVITPKANQTTKVKKLFFPLQIYI